MKDAVISKLSLDMPDDKGVSKRRLLNKVYEQSGKLPAELEQEVFPEFNDEPIFNQFFEMFQRGKEFYQTLYYYQKINHIEYDGENLNLLLILWNSANHYLYKQDKAKNKRQQKGAKPSKK